MDENRIEQDTIKLLRECDAGVKMGTSFIEDVLDNVRSKKLEKLLTDCKKAYKLRRKISGRYQRVFVKKYFIRPLRVF